MSKHKTRNRPRQKRIEIRQRRFFELGEQSEVLRQRLIRDRILLRDPTVTCSVCLTDYPFEDNVPPLTFVCKRCLKNCLKNRASTSYALRRARELQAMPAWADQDAIRAVYKQAKEITKATGIVHHVDHIVPLTSPIVCGLHIAENLQIVPAEINRKKHNKFSSDEFLTWLAEIETLIKI